MKKIFFTFSAILLGFISYCQTGLTENFDDGDLTGWSGQADYKLINVGGELIINTNKTSTWNSFQFDLMSPIDISANPFVSIKLKLILISTSIFQFGIMLPGIIMHIR